MGTRTSIAYIGLALATAGPAGLAEPLRKGALVAEIVPSRAAIAPGETIDLALRIAHDPGWHTYWMSPGIVGLATGIDWGLPDGFEAAPILWPQPERVKMGPYHAYGYRDEVFLVVPLTAPADARPGETAVLKARASWMCCSKTCHPAFVDLQLALPIAAAPAPATKWQKGISASRATFPKPNTAWSASAEMAGETVLLKLSPKERARPSPPDPPYFFSYDGLIHSDAEQDVTRGEDGSLTLELTTSEFGPENPTRLRGILYTPSGKPDGSGAVPVELDVPLSTGP